MKKYQHPQLSVIAFDGESVILTSTDPFGKDVLDWFSEVE